MPDDDNDNNENELDDVRGSEDQAAYARNSDPFTSHEAAEAVDANEYEAMVLAALRHFKTASQWEIVSYLNLPYNSITPRFKPLIEKGMIEICGKAKNPHTNRTVLVYREVNKVNAPPTETT
jgi:DNA-binding MarR family transcriptional regulator